MSDPDVIWSYAKFDDSIRALAADPEAIARIAKAAEERG